MKNFLKSLFFSVLLLLPFSASIAAEKFILDNQHTYVLWEIEHLGFSTQAGKWYVNGEILLDKDHPENSSVNATIKIADLVTGIPELDKHLKAALFFDEAQYPTATFVSKKVKVLSNNSAKVDGILTMHGVSKPVTLNVQMNKVGKNPLTDKMTVGFTATTVLKRSDFGVNALLPNLGDEVKIKIGAEAYQAANPQGLNNAD